MQRIKPFTGLRPTVAHVKDIVAPPYDVINKQQAKALAANNPLSFLHISKPEIDCPPDTPDGSEKIYQQGLDNLNRLLQDDVFIKQEQPVFYVYRITYGKRSQTGIACIVNVESYQSGFLKTHELTRPDKEIDRRNVLQHLKTHISPVLLSYQGNNIANSVAITTPANYSFISDDQVAHDIWIIQQQDVIDDLTEQLNQLNALYIADGHHRSAAAAGLAQQTDDPIAQYFLAVLFPANELQILSYNRIIKGLNGLSAEEFLQRVQQTFTISKENKPVAPQDKTQIGLYLQGQWYRLKKPDSQLMNISLLHDFIVDPILNITNPREDKRIQFIGGNQPLTSLQEYVDKQEADIAFSLFATTMQELIDVSDQGKIMPPKSTWFEPKLLDGFFCYV